MSSIVVNRALLILAFIGIFVAGVLSAGHLFDLTPPCGGSQGCAAVAAHPASKLFGIPVAYMGFVTYVLLAALAGIRSAKGLKGVGHLVTGGYVLSAIGTGFSLYLQYQSLTVIHATCPWCVTSAVIMILNLIGYAVLAQTLDKNVPETNSFWKLDSMLLMGLPFVVVIATTVVVWGRNKEIANTVAVSGPINPEMAKLLIPENGHSIGPKDAALTVVEFADLQCPACQSASPKLKHFQEEFPNSMRVIYRHFPLSMHTFGTPSAAVAEYAGEKGKFWEFAMALMNLRREIKSPDELYDVASSVGLDRAELEKRIADPSDPIYARVTADMEVADKVGISITPTFFIITKDNLEVANQSQLFEKLQSDQYQAILKAGSAAPSTPAP